MRAVTLSSYPSVSHPRPAYQHEVRKGVVFSQFLGYAPELPSDDNTPVTKDADGREHIDVSV